MKKVLLVAVMALVGCFVSANAQGLILKVGGNLNSYTADLESAKTDMNKSILGFHVGAGYEIGIIEYFAIEPGVLFDTRGFKSEMNVGSVSTKMTENIYSITIPVALKGKFPISDDFKIFAGLAPFANIGLVGNKKFDTELGDLSIDKKPEEFKFGNEVGDKNRINYGLNFNAGVEYSKMSVSVGYDMMMSDGINQGDIKGTIKDFKPRYNALKITLGYRL